MKYIEGIPTKNQQEFLKMITKLDKEIFPDSIILRIPDARALEEKYEKNLREAKNNFERKKIENDYKSKQMIYDNLGLKVKLPSYNNYFISKA